MKLHPKDRLKLEKLIGRITTEVFRHNLKETELNFDFEMNQYACILFILKGNEVVTHEPFYFPSKRDFVKVSQKEYTKNFFSYLYKILNTVKNYGNTRKA